jgi:hypothetical protein
LYDTCIPLSKDKIKKDKTLFEKETSIEKIYLTTWLSNYNGPGMFLFVL